MNNEWIELNDLQAVAKAQARDWEIEFISGGVLWKAWDGRWWGGDASFRGRPRQPVMRKVKMLCWYDKGTLRFVREGWPVVLGCIRIPAQDIEIDLPDAA